MDIPPVGGRNGRSGTPEGGYLRLPLPEHVCTVHCYQAYSVPVSGGVDDTDTNHIQAMVRTGRGGCGRYVDSCLGGVTDGVGGGDGQDEDRDGDGLNWLEYNKANTTLETDPDAPFSYALLLEEHHPIMSMLGYPIGQLEI